LIAVLKIEGRYAEALSFARELEAKYPRNFLFKLEVAGALVSQAKLERQTNPIGERTSAKPGIFDALLSSQNKSARNASSPAAARFFDQVHSAYGEALLASGQAARGRNFRRQQTSRIPNRVWRRWLTCALRSRSI
jgi:hypothetical protein